MDPKDRIAQNERLDGVLAEISSLFQNADRDALVAALASNDPRALARALKVSPEALPDLIKAVTDGAGDLVNLPEVKAAGRLLSE
jgi:hypothetical protein